METINLRYGLGLRKPKFTIKFTSLTLKCIHLSSNITHRLRMTLIYYLWKRNAYRRNQISWLMRIIAEKIKFKNSIQNNFLFLGLYECTSARVHQSTSRTPPTCGRFMYAIQNNSLFLGLFQVSRQDYSDFPRVDDPCMQSRTTPCF